MPQQPSTVVTRIAAPTPSQFTEVKQYKQLVQRSPLPVTRIATATMKRKNRLRLFIKLIKKNVFSLGTGMFYFPFTSDLLRGTTWHLEAALQANSRGLLFKFFFTPLFLSLIFTRI